MTSIGAAAGGALAGTAVLFLFGDFTPYVGDPDHDVWVRPPARDRQLLLAAGVAVPFAAGGALLAAATGRLLPGARPLRLGLVLAPGLCAVVYAVGPFKELHGGGPPYRVRYELPRGPERLLVSAACAAGLATLAALGCRAWDASAPEVGRRAGTKEAA